MTAPDLRDSPVSPEGVLVVDKPEGPTSHDVVAVARRALRVREVGHTGTLDPMATGVLALVVGRATRLAQFLSGQDKSYDARVHLGVATDSWDRTGTVVHEAPAAQALPGPETIEAALASFVGDLEQRPPVFSAKKVAGERAYRLARKGREVAVAPVRVTLRHAEVTEVRLPFVDVRLRCSSGFYVRSLAHDLGETLGCGACLESLRRTASGSFSAEDAVSLDVLARSRDEAIARLVPLEAALREMPSVTLNAAGVARARHGNEVGPGECEPRGAAASGEAVQLLDESGRLLAIARPAARAGFLHPVVVLG